MREEEGHTQLNLKDLGVYRVVRPLGTAVLFLLHFFAYTQKITVLLKRVAVGKWKFGGSL